MIVVDLRVIALASVALAGSLASGCTVEGGPSLDELEAGRYGWTSYSVVPVLFVPRDWDAGSYEVQHEASTIAEALIEIQDFYLGQLGRSFILEGLDVVQGDGWLGDYGILWNGKNIYTEGVEFPGNPEAEVTDELYARGYPAPPGQDESGYTILIFFKGTGGYAGTREFDTADGGWSILGDWAIDSIDGTLAEGDYIWSGRRKQTGAVAHEIGHTFFLPHPEDVGWSNESSIMGAWWNYPAAGLNDYERSRITTYKVPFFCDRVALQAYGGQYLVAEGGGGREVRADRAEVREWETFYLHHLRGGTSIALQAHDGSYLRAVGGGGGEVRADAPRILDHETLELVSVGENLYGLRAASGQYLVAEGGGGDLVLANRGELREWETFRLQCVD